MEENLSGSKLAELLKNLADRIQSNHDDTEGIILKLREITRSLEAQNWPEDG